MRRPLAAAPPAALLLLAGALTACSKAPDPAAPAAVAGAIQERERTRVRVRPVERREMVRRLQTTTEAESVQEVEIFPLASGVVTELRAEEGDRVEAGEVLAVLDQREPELALEDAEVALKEARQAVEKAALAIREAEGRAAAQELLFEAASSKYQRNVNARLISDQDLEQLENERDTAERNWKNAQLEVERAGFEHRAAQTTVERAELTLERARVTLSHTELRAPFAGVIAERLIDLGDNAGPGSAAFRLTDDRNLRAIIYRPQRELALFAPARADYDRTGPGIEISATAEALPGLRFTGEIQRISPGIDPESGAFRVTIGLRGEADGARLLPGMLLRLEIVVERHPDALVVPKRALRREGETTILFRVAGDTVERVVVDEGFDDDQHVEVLPREGEALAPGDRVVVVGNRDLDPGERVEVEPWPGEEGPGEEGPEDAAPSGGEPAAPPAAEELAREEGDDADGEPGAAPEGEAADGDGSSR